MRTGNDKPRVNKPLKRPTFFSIFRLLLSRCSICRDKDVPSVAKLPSIFFINLYLNSLSIFVSSLLYFCFSYTGFAGFILFPPSSAPPLSVSCLFISVHFPLARFFHRVFLVWPRESYMDRFNRRYQQATSRALINHDALLFHRAF